MFRGLGRFMARCYRGGLNFTEDNISRARIAGLLDVGLALLFGYSAYATGMTFYAGLMGSPAVSTFTFVAATVFLPINVIMGVPAMFGLARAACDKSGRVGSAVVRVAQYPIYDVPDHVRSVGRAFKRGGQKLTSVFKRKAKRPYIRPTFEDDGFTFDESPRNDNPPSNNKPGSQP